MGRDFLFDFRGPKILQIHHLQACLLTHIGSLLSLRILAFLIKSFDLGKDVLRWLCRPTALQK